MAVPSGYVWVRELDPNAQWNQQNRTITILGRTYQPGEYYLENGRAYVPNPVPKGYQWIRSYFAPDQVSYDPATKTVKLPGGLNLPQSSLLTVGGRTYAPASQLAQAYQTYAATYQPKQPTAEETRRLAETYMQIYGPLADVARERLGFNLKKIQETAEQQRRLAEAAYQTGLSSLRQAETSSWNAIMKSALARGLGASPLASYEQRKVAETYAPEYQKLETNRAAQLANIASQAALSAEELAMQGRELEARWASQIAQYAYNALQSDAAEQKKAVQNLADYFAALSESQAKAQQEAAKLAWEKEKAYLPYMYAPKEALLPYELGPTPYQQQSLAQQRELGLKEYLYGPTPYQQAQIAIQQLRASRSGGGGTRLTATDVKNITAGSYANYIKRAVDEAWAEGGWAKAVEKAPAIHAEILAAAPELRKAGVNVNDLIDYLYTLIGGFTKKDGKWVLESEAQQGGRL